MGTCGCADFRADHLLCLPDGSVVALQVHHCVECSDGIGVLLHHVPAAEVKTWIGDNAGTWRTPETVVDGKTIASTPLIRVLDLRQLRERMARWATKHAKDYDPAGLVQDALDRAVAPVLCQTMAADTATKLGKDGWKRIVWVKGRGFDCHDAWEEDRGTALERGAISKAEAERKAVLYRRDGFTVRVIRLRPKKGAST